MHSSQLNSRKKTPWALQTGQIKLLRVYFHQKKVQRGKAKGTLNGAVSLRPWVPGQRFQWLLVGSSLLTKPVWPRDRERALSRRRKPTDPTGSGKTLQVAAGEGAARTTTGSWALVLAVLRAGFLKRR